MKDLQQFAMAAMLLLSSCASAVAEEAPPPAPPGQIDDGDCDDLLLGPPVDGEGGVTGLIGGANTALSCDQFLRDHLTVTYQTQTIRRVVVGRLIGGPVACGQIDEEQLTEEQRRRREEDCSDQSGLVITQAGAPGQKLVNVWTDAKASWIESGNKDFSPTDGPMFNATAGADYRISDRMVIGVFGSFENSDLETGGFIPSTTATQGLGGGLYTGITLTPNIVFSGMLSGAGVETDLDYGFVAAALDSTRLTASGSLTGYWYFSQIRWSPSVSLAWSKEWQDAFTDNLGFPGPSQTYESAVLTIGSQLGRTFALDNGGTLEPWGGYQFDWTFLSAVDVDGFGQTDYEDSYDLRIQAGLNYGVAGGGTLSVTGEIGGLLIPDNTVFSGNLNYSIQF